MSLDFPGKDKLLRRIDAALGSDCPREITSCLQEALCECIDDEDIRLPDAVYEDCEDHYARREIHQDPELGYSVIAMTWGPGQGTPIHDHAGMWCVEGVWAGSIRVEQFDLREQDDDRFRFERMGSIRAGCGSAGSLIPPHEYHTICNPDSERCAVSLHIYSGPMDACNIFEEQDNGWHVRHRKQLALD